MININKAGIAPLAIVVIIGVAVGGAVTIPVAADITVGDSIGPSNPFYTLERVGESIRLAVTPGGIEKAKLRLQMATERLQEIKVEIEAGNYEHVESLSNDYGLLIPDIAKGLVNEEGELIDENLAKLVEEATSIHQKVISSLVGSVPEDAQGALNEALENSKTGHGKAKEALGKIGGRP